MKVVWPAIAVVVGIVALGALIGRLSCAIPDGRLLTPNVVQTQSNPELVVAVEKARHSLDKFIARFQHPEPGDRSFGVQGAFKTSGQDEHIWIHLDKYDNGSFTGRLDDEPTNVPGKHKGDTVTVSRDNVTDWIFQSNGKKMGGFTIDALEGHADAAGRN